MTCFIGVGLISSQAQQVKMTLSESITYALENNTDVKNAQLETLISRATIGEQRSQGLPQINSTLELTKNVQPPLIILPAVSWFGYWRWRWKWWWKRWRGLPPPDDSPSDITVIPFAVNFQSSLTTTIEQMIFNGSYFVGLKAAKNL